MAREKLPVIFRKLGVKDGGEVVAFFPTLVYRFNQHICLSYMHNGQHSAACAGFITTLKKCTPEEYGPLLNELKGIYENEHYGEPVELEVVDRSSRKYYNIRLAETRRMLGTK